MHPSQARTDSIRQWLHGGYQDRQRALRLLRWRRIRSVFGRRSWLEILGAYRLGIWIDLLVSLPGDASKIRTCLLQNGSVNSGHR